MLLVSAPRGKVGLVACLGFVMCRICAFILVGAAEFCFFLTFDGQRCVRWCFEVFMGSLSANDWVCVLSCLLFGWGVLNWVLLEVGWCWVLDIAESFHGSSH